MEGRHQEAVGPVESVTEVANRYSTIVNGACSNLQTRSILRNIARWAELLLAPPVNSFGYREPDRQSTVLNGLRSVLNSSTGSVLPEIRLSSVLRFC